MSKKTKVVLALIAIVIVYKLATRD